MLWLNEAVEVIEAIEAVEAIEVIDADEFIETAEVLRLERSLLRSKESSRFLNSGSL